jgi:hypothetical protein
VPVLTENNHIFSCKPVNQEVINRVEKEIGQTIPEEVKSSGKLFRKYLGNLLTGQLGTVKQMMGKADTIAETAVSEFLSNIGIVYLVWPHAQTKPDGDTNRAVLNERDIRVLKIEQVEVDKENKLVEGSEKIISNIF